ncbi:MAG TPA: hypothetical protein VFS96_04515 [Nitrolancea sp.]|nr:hypothetical protein [Nitrolancea sp.]
MLHLLQRGFKIAHLDVNRNKVRALRWSDTTVDPLAGLRVDRSVLPGVVGVDVPIDEPSIDVLELLAILPCDLPVYDRMRYARSPSFAVTGTFDAYGRWRDILDPDDSPEASALIVIWRLPLVVRPARFWGERI